jgi:uncharacterized protein YbjT (DUF2867 family)
METQQTVLLLGATGRTGQRVLAQLLGRGISVRVVVRSARRLSAGAAKDPGLTVVEGELLSLTDEELLRQLRGCDAVISCLGHVISLKGVFGPPRDLVTRATARVCRGIEALQPAKPVKLILMSTVAVHRPGKLDALRKTHERAFLWLLRALIPPARDNQTAADFLQEEIGTANPHVQWVVVRPDTLMEGDVSEYTLHEGLVSSLASPSSTRMANVAHFMCELAANPKAWGDWKGKLPVVVDAVRTPSRS